VGVWVWCPLGYRWQSANEARMLPIRPGGRLYVYTYRSMIKLIDNTHVALARNDYQTAFYRTDWRTITGPIYC